MLRSTWILFTTHVLRTLRSRRALVCFCVALIPVAIAVLIRAFAAAAHASPPAVAIGYLIVVQTVVPIIAVVLGAPVVSEEVEDRTITYLITRPIPRASILLGRWMASALVLACIVAISAWAVVVLLEGIGAADPETAVPAGFAARLVGVAVVGAVVYSALFAAIGSFLKRPVLLGLGYTFAVEFLLTNLPFASQRITLQYYLKSLLFAHEPELVARLSGDLVKLDLATPGEAARTLVLTAVGALAIGAMVLSRRQVLLSA